jgi:hypothetical protein
VQLRHDAVVGAAAAAAAVVTLVCLRLWTLIFNTFGCVWELPEDPRRSTFISISFSTHCGSARSQHAAVLSSLLSALSLIDGDIEQRYARIIWSCLFNSEDGLLFASGHFETSPEPAAGLVA